MPSGQWRQEDVHPVQLPEGRREDRRVLRSSDGADQPWESAECREGADDSGECVTSPLPVYP